MNNLLIYLFLIKNITLALKRILVDLYFSAYDIFSTLTCLDNQQCEVMCMD